MVTQFRRFSWYYVEICGTDISTARVFTTIQETQDTTLLASFLIAVLLNGIIFAQILVYSNAEDSNTQTAQGSTAAAPTSPKKVRPKRD